MDPRTHAYAHRGALVLLVFSGAGCSFAGVGAGALGGSRGIRKREGHPLIVGEIPLVLQSWHPRNQLNSVQVMAMTSRALMNL